MEVSIPGRRVLKTGKSYRGAFAGYIYNVPTRNMQVDKILKNKWFLLLRLLPHESDRKRLAERLRRDIVVE